MSIETIQNDFIDAIFGGDKSSAISHVVGDETLNAEQRIGIYSGSVHGILTQAMGLTFPVCKALVGEEFFNNMSKLFIDKHPPTTSFFAEYGDKFPLFLETFEHVKDIPYFVDIARLEWARHDAWHQQQAPSADFSALASLSEEQQTQVVFQVSNRLRLIQSNYRIDDIWFAHQEHDDDASMLESTLKSINIDKPVKLFVFKDQDIIKISIMNENEADSAFWDFIYAITKGNNLEMLAETFGESLPDHLNQAIQSGWITSFN